MTVFDWIDLVAFELAALVLLGVDWYQTVQIQRRGHTEANPILGAHPTDFAIGGYFLAWMLAEVGLFVFLLRCVDPSAALLLAAVLVLVEAYTVGWNRALGDGP